jgi:hypothetical protein
MFLYHVLLLIKFWKCFGAYLTLMLLLRTLSVVHCLSRVICFRLQFDRRKEEKLLLWVPYNRYSQTMKMEAADSETRRYISASLNCVTFQKTAIFIFISLRTSNVTSRSPKIDAAEHTAIERRICYGDHELSSAVATQLKLGVTQIAWINVTWFCCLFSNILWQCSVSVSFVCV